MGATAADDFAGTGALSGNWSVIAGAATRVAGILTGSAWPFAARWTGTTFTADHTCGIVLTGAPANYVAVVARFTAGFNGYILQATSAGQLILSRDDAGVPTPIGTLSGYTFIAGDVIELRIVGNQVKAYYNGVEQGTGATEGTYTAAASPGVVLGASGDTVDSWFARDLFVAPPPVIQPAIYAM